MLSMPAVAVVTYLPPTTLPSLVPCGTGREVPRPLGTASRGALHAACGRLADALRSVDGAL